MWLIFQLSDCRCQICSKYLQSQYGFTFLRPCQAGVVRAVFTRVVSTTAVMWTVSYRMINDELMMNRLESGSTVTWNAFKNKWCWWWTDATAKQAGMICQSLSEWWPRLKVGHEVPGKVEKQSAIVSYIYNLRRKTRLQALDHLNVLFLWGHSERWSTLEEEQLIFIVCFCCKVGVG